MMNDSSCCHQVSADSGRSSLVDGTVNEGSTTPKHQPKQQQLSTGGRATRRRNHIIYEFDFPTELCGRLIGRNGKNINILKDRSGVEITIKRKSYTKELQVVCLEGEHAFATFNLLSSIVAQFSGLSNVAVITRLFLLPITRFVEPPVKHNFDGRYFRLSLTFNSTSGVFCRFL